MINDKKKETVSIGFVVGKLEANGRVKGVRITGVQPYTNFQQAIEEQLAN